MSARSLSKLELRLFGSLLRSGFQFDKIIKAKNGNIEREIRRLGHLYPLNVNRRYDSMRRAISSSFRESKVSSFDNDKVFYAMRSINNRLNIISNKEWAPNEAIQYDVGMIMRHKKWKFRLVLVDVFKKCPADQQWIETYGPFEHGTDQPFYKTMVCTKDREPFMSIAAQENLIQIDATQDGEAVEHPLINQVFSGYDRDGGRMIPKDEYGAHQIA